mgnify:CR=1 FL=1
MSYAFKLPDIGEGLYEAEVVQWLVNVGDVIEPDQNIVEVMTDKAVVEISSPVGGEVLHLGADVNEVIKVGETLAVIDTAKKEASTQPDLERKVKVLAAPKVRKLAREMNIDLAKVPPTGKRGKVTREDVYRYLEEHDASRPENIQKEMGQKNALASVQGERSEDEHTRTDWAADAWSEHVPSERQKISGLRKKIYENMVISAAKIPHSTGMDEFDVTKLVEFRATFNQFLKQQGMKVTYLPFIVKAVAVALQDHPLLNATIDEERMEIIYHKPIHIGVATATEEGLVVPVIKNADRKTIEEIAVSIEDLADRARQKRIKPDELRGSTFTISNTGASGGFFAVPIINYPEVAILGVHRIEKKPVVRDDDIVIGHVMGISLTFDHRIIDGEPAGQFLAHLRNLLEHPELLLLKTK